jgi:exopolysaccharide biosynthesis polyprenyl glycosylphosphotransferase
VRLRPKLGRLDRPEVRVHWIAQDVPLGAEPWQGQPTWGIQRVPWSLRCGRLAKRGLDIVVSLVALIALSPLLAAIALAIQLSTGQPVLYSQLRVGQGGRLFRIWKFRSMRVDAERETGPVWACNHDERCTRIGDFLRQTNLDELPQLFNVLIGDMSLVGPRPERPMFVEKFRGELPAYEDRHAVPVGLTGWAQIHGWRGRTSLRKRIQYDLDYIRHWSLAMDLRILLMTVPHVVRGKIRWGGGVRWLRRRRPR